MNISGPSRNVRQQCQSLRLGILSKCRISASNIIFPIDANGIDMGAQYVLKKARFYLEDESGNHCDNGHVLMPRGRQLCTFQRSTKLTAGQKCLRYFKILG
jgi:hypothetical protein